LDPAQRSPALRRTDGEAGEEISFPGGTGIGLRASFIADLCRCGSRPPAQASEPMGRAARALFRADVRVVDWPCNRCSDLSLGLRTTRPLGQPEKQRAQQFPAGHD
jgi:hypothetical protein